MRRTLRLFDSTGTVDKKAYNCASRKNTSITDQLHLATHFESMMSLVSNQSRLMFGLIISQSQFSAVSISIAS